DRPRGGERCLVRRGDGPHRRLFAGHAAHRFPQILVAARYGSRREPLFHGGLRGGRTGPPPPPAGDLRSGSAGAALAPAPPSAPCIHPQSGCGSRAILPRRQRSFLVIAANQKPPKTERGESARAHSPMVSALRSHGMRNANAAGVKMRTPREAA